MATTPGAGHRTDHEGQYPPLVGRDSYLYSVSRRIILLSKNVEVL